MNVTYACPACEAGTRSHFDADTRHLRCHACGQVIDIPEGAVPEDAVEGGGDGRGRVKRCLVCPSTDLYVRKDFPQRLGVLLVAIGIIGSSIAWYYADLFWTFGILFATALADVLLYAFVGDALMCYRCHAQYRGVAEMDSHGMFDLETHERHRQLSARLRSATQTPRAAGNQSS